MLENRELFKSLLLEEYLDLLLLPLFSSVKLDPVCICLGEMSGVQSMEMDGMFR